MEEVNRIKELSYGNFYLLPGYLQNISEKIDTEELFNLMSKTLEWKQGKVIVYGKQYNEPRKTVMFSTKQGTYTYSNKSNQPHPFPEFLENIRVKLSEVCNVQFDTLLCNFYSDGNDKIGMHSDSEASLLPDAPIASLSLGATRHFDIHMKPIKNNSQSSPNHGQTELSKYRIDLKDGDLLIMGENSQKNYLHGVPVEKKVKTPRINLTFRVTK